MNKLLTSAGLALCMFLFANVAHSQTCNIKVDATTGCVPASFAFEGELSGGTATKWDWDFGNGNSGSGQTFNQIYNGYGTFTVTLTVTLASGGTCIATTQVEVYDKPTACFIDPSSTTQCFDGNKFLFQNCSQAGASGAAIVQSKNYWEFGDGNTSNAQNPEHTYGYGGYFTVSLEVVDANGCTDFIQKTNLIYVRPELDPKFTAQYQVTCPETKVTFTNNTTLNDPLGNNKNLDTYTWDFADGSPPVSGTVGDANWAKIVHIYKDDGFFKPTLTVTSTDGGCTETFTIGGSGVQNIYYEPNIVMDPHDSCWAGNSITLRHKPRPNAYAKVWNFGDPDSGPLNVDDESWSPTHRFVGPAIASPNWFTITLTIAEPNCVMVLTHCDLVALKGPQARIQLPPPPLFPPNNCAPFNEIPLIKFQKMAENKECYNQIMEDSTIVYDIVTKKATPDTLGSYQVYCNADTIGFIHDTMFRCAPTAFGEYPFDTVIAGPPKVWRVGKGVQDTFVSIIPILDPNQVNTNYILDEYNRTTVNWKYTDPIPTQTVYMPLDPACSNNPQQMNDSDLFISTCSAPNLVRFTNNTVKFRLNNAYDNNPPFNPVPYDTCASPETGFAMADGITGRWGSDSLQYMWNFGDGSDPCTSTPQNPDINCLYSTEIAPYHLYEEEGCWTATLTAYDPVTNCTHTASVFIVMEPPQAGWDTTAYGQKMTWVMQATQIVKSDTPLYGLFLQGLNCLGGDFPQVPIFDETKPSCPEQEDWWIVFDAEKDKNDSFECDVYDAATNTTTTVWKYHYNWIDKATFFGPYMGQWIYPLTEPGCKTIGVRIKTGECYDEAWYENYKYFPESDARFTLRDTATSDELIWFCPEQPIFFDINNDSQKNITDYRVTWYNQTAVFTAFAVGVDSVTLIDETVYTICDSTKFTIDPVNGKKVYSECFNYPPVECPDPDITLPSLADVLTGARKIVNTFNTYDLSQRIERTIVDPGRYVALAQLTTVVPGCGGFSQLEFFVGHINRFFMTDTIICVGETIDFRDSLFYWTYYDPIQYPLGYDPKPFWDDPIGLRATQVYQPDFYEKFEWDFGDGSPVVTTPDPSHDYSQPGRYRVTLTSWDSTGCKIVTERFVNVINVTAGFRTLNPGDTLRFCAQQFIQFFDTSVVNLGNNPNTKLDTAAKWTWTFDDGKGSKHTKNPVHPFTRNDTFDIYLKVTTGQGCVDSIKINDYITIVGPKTGFEIIDPIEGCEPFEMRVRLFDPSAVSYEWRKVYVPTGDTIKQLSPKGQDTVILTFNKPGDYVLYVAAADSVINPLTGNLSRCVTIYPDTANPNDPVFNVKVNPRDSVKIELSDTLVCPFVPITFTDVSQAANPPYTQFIWDFGDGNTGSGKTVQHAYSQPGVYNITYIPSGANCPDTAYATVRVDDVTAAFTAQPDPSDVTIYHFTNTSTNATSYTWDFGDNTGPRTTTNKADPFHMPYKFPGQGFYEVCLIAKNAEGCSDTTCITIQVEVSVKLSNVFTPNGDGINDEFVIEINGEIYYEMLITNRWGEKVFESNNKQRVWNGHKNNTGAELPDGTYFFLFKYQLAGQERQEVKGTVTLLRDK